MMQLPMFYVEDLIRRALAEDISYLDTTTDYMIPEDARNTAVLISAAVFYVLFLPGSRRVDCLRLWRFMKA